MKFKRKIAQELFQNNKFTNAKRTLVKINMSINHSDMKEKLIHPGIEDPEKNFLIIRPSGSSEGLISSYFTAAEQVLWSYRNQYVPFIDYESSNCQYYTGRNINWTVNAWEYYFRQPENLSKSEILSKRNVLLSGWTWKEKDNLHITRDLSLLKNEELKNICLRRLGINKYVYQELQKRVKRLPFSNKTLGVFIRGTDYIALRPKGHPVQPTIDAVIEKINEFNCKYNISNIYVVTEDISYFKKLKDTFGQSAFSADDDFVKNYDSSDLLESSFNNDPYERGMNYIIRLLLLNRCKYLISSITNGSLFARLEKLDDYEEEFWFDLGVY